ncbi:hypothetical protein POM88_013855 [Heracleum sosnowskyi]|uniref:Uncharacterized protein n=1 Tax=Heracleum sosnowskyi TaxID=360622 RepID=A0AAD8J0X7_9APIA|nr:hypothetical protein POM88_013855 [Heracleum sosnowskyi]
MVEKAVIKALSFIDAHKDRGEAVLWCSFGTILVAVGVASVAQDVINNLLFGLKLFRSWQVGRESLEKFNRACEENGCLLGGFYPNPLHDRSAGWCATKLVG